jgi:hypothetical protein
MPDSGHALVVKYGFSGLPGILLGTGYVVAIVTGFYGFFEAPPASVHAIIGFTVFAVMWNLAFIILGGIGLLARSQKAPRTEIVAVETLAAVLDTWALMTFLTPQSNQAGLAFIAVSLLLYGWAAGTRSYLKKQERNVAVLREE